MMKKPMITTTIPALLIVSCSAYAEQHSYASHHEKMMRHHSLPPMPMSMPISPRMDEPRFSDFPPADELARMTPPEPMTEEKISKRFAKRKAHLNKVLDKDRKAAEKYAQEFARFQKHQSDSLAKLMAKAEQRREQMLKRLDEQEQRVLQNFRGRNAQAQESAAAEPVTRP